MNRKSRQIIIQLIEKELIVILAVVVLLGILIGYSLAAARFESSHVTISPNIENSLLRADLGAGEMD